MGSRSGTSSGAQAAHARPISTSFQVADHTECITPPQAYMALVRFRPPSQRQCRPTILRASVARK